MKTNVKMTKLVRRVMTIAAAMLMVFTVFAAAVPAQAANVGAPQSTFNFTKYLVMPTEANMPDATFTFAIKPGEAAHASGSAPAIMAGVGNPTVSNAEFTTEHEVHTTVQGGDNITLGAGEKYAKTSVTVTFPADTFTAPGIYRYELTENRTDVQGFTSSRATIYLYVTVTYDGGSETNLKVASYELKADDAVGSTAKAQGFTNTYATRSLTLTKDVTGNQGDRSKYFEFKVKLTVDGNTTYAVTVPTENSHSSNPKSITDDDGDGVIEATYYLMDNQSIVIKGLDSTATYNITETSYATEGYTTKYKVDNGEEQSNNTASGTMGTADHTVVFTNHKEGTVPTGVLLEIAPYIALAVVVIAGFVVLFATRRRRER